LKKLSQDNLGHRYKIDVSVEDNIERLLDERDYQFVDESFRKEIDSRVTFYRKDTDSRFENIPFLSWLSKDDVDVSYHWDKNKLFAHTVKGEDDLREIEEALSEGRIRE
jgi:hypothetical protein